MEPWTIAIVVGSLAVVAILLWFVYDRRRSQELRERFGPEYERTVTEIGSRRRAESQLAQREAQAKELRARPMNVSDRDRFLSEWKLCQAQFVDDPAGAVEKADELLADMMHTRGYAVDDPYERMKDIAAAHPDHAQEYRDAGEIVGRHHRGKASTEELREAFLHYRTLFNDLLGGHDKKYRRVS
jgi:hypothetical protein